MAIGELNRRSASREVSAANRASEAPSCVVIAHTPRELREHEAAWRDLADHALEANVFYEPCMLLPAFEALGGEGVRFVLIYSGTRLDGFFPIEQKRRYKNLPVRALSLWKHLHCFLCTPLIRNAESLARFFDWAKDEGRAAAVEFDTVGADGRFQQILTDIVFRNRLLTFEDSKHTRALLKRGADGETYLQSALSKGNRRELRRQRKRLAELGDLHVRVLEERHELESWLEQFLWLEAAGWKERTALAADDAQRTFFMNAARAAFERGRLMMMGLALDRRFIAMKCNFLSKDGAFAYKIAFDESFNRFSPGVQLELENILAVHARGDVPWMDSCAVPDHFMINRLWKDRRTIQTLLVSTGDWRGDLLASALPMLRWVGRVVCKRT